MSTEKYTGVITFSDPVDYLFGQEITDHVSTESANRTSLFMPPGPIVWTLLESSNAPKKLRQKTYLCSDIDSVLPAHSVPSVVPSS